MEEGCQKTLIPRAFWKRLFSFAIMINLFVYRILILLQVNILEVAYMEFSYIISTVQCIELPRAVKLKSVSIIFI